MPYFEIGANDEIRRYHYVQQGTGDAVILFHGFTGSHTTWEAIIPALAQHFRVIAIDLPGHGRTQVPDVAHYEMQHIATDLRSCLHENGIDSYHLIGYSMGGRFALYFADNNHTKSLILESASPGLATESERQERKLRDDALADKIEANGIEWFAEFWESLSLWDSQSQTLKAKLRQERLQNSPQGLARSLRGMGTGVMPPLWEKLATLMIPTKLIVGVLDSKFVTINRQMRALFTDVDLDIIDDTGHTVHLEATDEFLKQTLQFLQKSS